MLSMKRTSHKSYTQDIGNHTTVKSAWLANIPCQLARWNLIRMVILAAYFQLILAVWYSLESPTKHTLDMGDRLIRNGRHLFFQSRRLLFTESIHTQNIGMLRLRSNVILGVGVFFYDFFFPWCCLQLTGNHKVAVIMHVCASTISYYYNYYLCQWLGVVPTAEERRESEREREQASQGLDWESLCQEMRKRRRNACGNSAKAQIREARFIPNP